MKRIVLLMTGLLMTVLAACQPSNSGITIDSVCEYLREEGYLPEKLDAQAACFKSEGDTYLIGVSNEKGWVGISATWRISTDQVQKLYRSAAKVMDEKIMVQIIVDEEDSSVTFALQQFCDSMSDYKRYFKRWLGILVSASSECLYQL